MSYIKTKALEKLYIGVMDIYEYESFVDENFVTKQKCVLKHKEIRCRVSYYNNSSNIVSSKENAFNNVISQKVKLFLNNDIQIKAGSLIVVTQNGKTTKYKNSGEPVIYTSHQEIMLDIFDDIG